MRVSLSLWQLSRGRWPSVAARIALVFVLAIGTTSLRAQPADEPKDFWHRDTLTGDWGGLRTQLSELGIVFSGTYTAEVFGNVKGGIRRGSTYDGLFLPQIDVDLNQLVGWTGASFRASMIQGHGPSISSGWVGNLMGPSGTLAVPPATRLYNLWLQQNLFNDVLSIRAGLMNVDAEFLLSPTASVFMNTTFGWPVWNSFNLPGGGPAYPLSAPGIRIRIKPEPEGLSLMVAGFSGDPTGHNGSNSLSTGIPSGTVVSFKGGTFLITELGYAINQADDAKGPPMTFKVGGWYHSSGRFQDQRYANDGLSLADPLSNGVPRNHAGNWGLYGVADVTLYQAENGGSLSGFVRMGGSPSDRNFISFYADAGLAYKGLIPTRDNDTLGLGVGFSRIGANVRGLDQDIQFFTATPSFPVQTQEVVLELTYQMQVTPWLTMQPDLQYVFNPGGRVLNADGSYRRDALILGLRSVLTF